MRRQDFIRLNRLARCTAPRKLMLSLPLDRKLAAQVIREARVTARLLGVRGYDRVLTIAAAYAHQEAEVGWDHPKVVVDHVKRQLVVAALD